jgi:hypothetical protein
MIDYNNKLIIVHPPRCGGSSLEKALFGKDMWEIQPWEKHLSADQIRKFLRLKHLDPAEFHWFGLVRDPVQRMESMFAHGVWHQTCQGSMGPRTHLSACEFASLVKPLVHEHRNLTLFEYHGRRNYELVDISQVDTLIEKLCGKTSCDRLEVTPPEFGATFGPLARAIVVLRMWRDFVYFSYPLRTSDVVLLPVAALAIIYYRLLAAITALYRRVSMAAA